MQGSARVPRPQQHPQPSAGFAGSADPGGLSHRGSACFMSPVKFLLLKSPPRLTAGCRPLLRVGSAVQFTLCPEPSAGDARRSDSPPGGTCLTARGPARPAARPTRLLWTRVRTQPARVSCRGSCTCVDAFSCRKAVLFPRNTQPMCSLRVQLCLHLPTCKFLAVGLIPFMIISCYGASYR